MKALILTLFAIGCCTLWVLYFLIALCIWTIFRGWILIEEHLRFWHLGQPD